MKNNTNRLYVSYFNTIKQNVFFCNHPVHSVIQGDGNNDHVEDWIPRSSRGVTGESISVGQKMNNAQRMNNTGMSALFTMNNAVQNILMTALG
ncbi:MAG: hypothetical protein JW925_12010 [Syntrophaceae bacterium]|nr:hypothetical protein [Syntrophaceae bacterium]